MTTILADYVPQCRAFEALLAPDCRKPVLLFYGESGSGKTTLVSVCLGRVPQTIPYIPVQLRGSAVGVADILSRLGQRLGWERMPNFTGRVAALQQAPRPGIRESGREATTQAQLDHLHQVLVTHFSREELRTLCFKLGIVYKDLTAEGRENRARELVGYVERRGRLADLVRFGKDLRPQAVWDLAPPSVAPSLSPQRLPDDRRWLADINRHIGVALHAETPTDRRHRRAALTQAWFDDLRAFDQPLLVALDTYEQATGEVQEWIGGPFLARVAQVNQLRVLLAGQQVPDPNNIEWGHCCASHELLGVPEAKHWLPVVKAMGRYIFDSDDEALIYLGVACHALKGDPREIMQFIQDLPRREGDV